MAIKFASGAKEEDCLPKKDAPATILNNHFDTDGFLIVWACLEPELALAHKGVIIPAADAGDFAEWTSENGVKLNFALESILSQVGGDDERAYDRALKEIPKLTLDFEETGGATYKDLWKNSFEIGRMSMKEQRRRFPRHLRILASECLVKELNEKLQFSDCWETGGPGDSMLSICATIREMQVKPEEMVTLLEEIETQLQEESAA
ncbi:MAG: hypothetical protein SGBAC_010368 [Bacillariaceae sp.]